MPAPSATSPNVGNYFIGKGIVTFKKEGASVARDLGNCPEVEFTPSADTLDHFSSRSGVKKKDLTVVLELGGELRIVMEELTADNLALLLLGDVDVTDPDAPVVNFLTQSAIIGEVRFYGTNDVGARVNMVWPRVSFVPSGSFSPITEEFGTMEVTGQVLADATGKFGTATFSNLVDGALIPVNIAAPFITGTAQENEVLTANVGTWVNDPTSYTYVWKADGVAISGATASTYTLTTAEVGKAITVEVTGVNTAGSSTAAASAPTADVIAAA